MKSNSTSGMTAKFAGFVAAAIAAVQFAAVAADVGFTVPYEDWRTPIQISPWRPATGLIVAGMTQHDFYEPVSVFTTNEEVVVSFGCANKGSSVTMPPVRFSIIDEHGAEVVAWTEPGRQTEVVSAGATVCSKNWPCEIVKFLAPGDYVLVAELDPANTLGESQQQRTDNTAIFRFAIRDDALTLAMMAANFNPAKVTSMKGNDFAQEPHAALRCFANGAGVAANADVLHYSAVASYLANGAGAAANAPMIQFGPYVPMDGKAVTSRKMPLDLVFLVDISGSMGGCIRGLLNNIGIFIDELMNGNEPIDDLRVKIVGFRDYKYSWDRNDLGWYDEGVFSDNLTVLKAKLNSFSARGGGGNGGETSLDALWYVAKDKAPNRLLNPTACVDTPSPFRPKSEAARAVVLFTDEAPHDPLSATGCAGLRIPDVVSAVEEAGINLTVITTMLSGYSGNYGVDRFEHLAATNKYASAAKNSTYIRTSNLATYANDTSALRALAQNILDDVDTIIVEPSLVVKSSELGILSFDWKNDSTAGTNNIFRFSAYDGGNRADPVTNIVCSATDRWERVSMELGDGEHTFEWNYRKIGYDGVVVDAGLIANLTWEPWATQLRLNPYEFEFECDSGLSGAVEVFCNETWQTLQPSAGWVHVNASGNGDGSFTFTVDPNTSHDRRTAVFKVRAGDHGSPSTDKIVERTVKISQKPSPYVERDLVEIFDVGVKPRWPWNTLVDIDFRIVTPAKNTPVELTIVGWDAQGEGCPHTSNLTSTNMREPPVEYVMEEQSRGVVVSSEGEIAKFTCKSSGVYRVTWDLGKWDDKDALNGNDLWGSAGNAFHTPDFRVILAGRAFHDGSIKSLTVTSTPVRVDTRVGGSNVLRDCGLIITGKEKIGHPDGAMDPFLWDSASVKDGWTDIRNAYPAGFVTEYMTNRCIVLNDVKVEGGVITNDTSWLADVVHVIRDNVYVKAGVKLTIEDGAVVKFCDSTKLFVDYDSNIDTHWNLEVKGAYMTGIADVSYGSPSNTMYKIYANVSEKGGWSLANGVFDDDYPGASSVLSSGGGITSIDLQVWDDNISNWYTKWCRTYTRDKPFGDLPRPVDQGEAFLGWFRLDTGTSPHTYITDAQSYGSIAGTAMIKTSEKPLSLEGHLMTGQFGAVSGDAATYPDVLWPKADGGIATITLAEDRFTYNGSKRIPVVTEVKVGEAVVPPSNYDLVYTDANGSIVSSPTDGGVYFVNVHFRYDYTNTPSASYAILPAVVTNATITVTNKFGEAIESYTYSGSKLPEPGIKVSVNERTLDSTEYTFDWSDGDWTSVGKYRATVEFRGNYTGTASADFEIRENPDLAVVFWEDATDVTNRLAQMTGQGYEPRILYLSGTDAPGNGGIATRGIKKLLQEDVAIRSFVLTNFVCRYADWDLEGHKTCTNEYDLAFGDDPLPLPFMGGVSTNTPGKCIVWTNGYMSASELLSFLVLAATTPEALLPDLGQGATDEQARMQIAKIKWVDPAVTNKIRNVTAYNKFRGWIDSLSDDEKDLLEGSARTYISSVISEILEKPYLLGDAQKVELSITDFKASTSSPGEYEVTINLDVGDPLVHLTAAKEAFAGKVRLGSDLKNLRQAEESDISDAAASGNRVVLTITMPSGNSGFIMMKIE